MILQGEGGKRGRGGCYAEAGPKYPIVIVLAIRFGENRRFVGLILDGDSLL